LPENQDFSKRKKRKVPQKEKKEKWGWFRGRDLILADLVGEESFWEKKWRLGLFPSVFTGL